MKLNIGISPCPNDTFIFDALYSKTIDTTPFEFEFVFEDVETLNNLALKGQLDIIKLSYANYFNVLEQYVMLRSGGALGTGVGPLLISKETLDLTQMSSYRIAIPGIHTTANFLLSYAFPDPLQKNEVVFSSIEDVVLTNQVDAGVIIHENRFTYQLKGLRKMMDLKVFVDADPDDRLIRVINRDIIERGRSVNKVMERYEHTVKPMHVQFIEPTKRFADIIIPQGGNNHIAIDILTKYIQNILDKK